MLSKARTVALIAAGIAALALSIAVTAGNVFAVSDPSRALAFWPNATAKAQMASRLIGDGTKPVDAAVARRLAREALDRSPVAAQAATTLGLAYGMSGEFARERAMFRYSERLTRRQLPTQLWAIEDAVGRGDVAAALLHYDRAMTTSTRSRALLMPVLAAAANDAAVRAPLIEKLRQRPAWWSEFAGQAIPIVKSPDALFAILSALKLRPEDVGEQRLLAFGLNQLVQRGGYRQAFTLYGETGRRSQAAAPLRNGGFDAANDLPPIEWSIVDDPVHNGTIQARDGGTGNALYLLGSETRTGVVARQLMMLRPDRYRLTFESGTVDPAATALPRITITCTGAPAVTLAERTFPAGDAAQRTAADFVVPAACPAQWIAIESGATSAQDGHQPWIDAIAVTAAHLRRAG